jgi:molybdopterin converting factor small subunit
VRFDGTPGGVVPATLSCALAGAHHESLFVGDESTRFAGGLATALADATEVSIVPAVSGG